MCNRHSVSKQADYKVDLLNDVTSHGNIHIHRRIRTNDPWSPRATYVLSVPGIVVAAAAETPCGLVMCANCNPVYFKQMACFSTLCNTISLKISVNELIHACMAVVGGGGQVRAPTIRASVKFRDFVEQYRR